MLTPWKKSYDQPRQHIKKQRHYFTNTGPFSQSYGFSSSHVWMCDLDYKELILLNCGVGEDSWRVLWTSRRSNQSILKEISPEYSLEGLKLKLQYFGHLIWRVDSLEKTDAGKDWRQEEKGTTEDEMVGRHHHNGHEFEQSSGVGDEQGSLVCCSLWGHKELDMNELLNWIEYFFKQ